MVPNPRKRDMLRGVDRGERAYTRREPIRWRRADLVNLRSLSPRGEVGLCEPYLCPRTPSQSSTDPCPIVRSTGRSPRFWQKKNGCVKTFK